MIFLSHNHQDKQLVEQFALVLSKVFGQDKIFYDSWSIQPGEGIIDKMNEGLTNCKFFFFFVSKNSLESKMVKLEWQNALLKATKNQCEFIPVKLDDCFIPEILLQSRYIDVFGQGPDIGVRQMIDVVNGKNIFKSVHQTYENLRAYVKSENKEVIIEFRAETYLEPHSRYIILLDNQKEDLTYKCLSDGMTMGGFTENLKLGDNISINGVAISVLRGTSPGFPFIIKLIPKENKEIKLRGVMRAVSSEMYRLVPIIPVR